MLGEDHVSLKVGKTALTWLLGQTNVWYMLYHFAHKASKENSFTQIQSDVSILDDLFTLGGESDQHTNLEELSRYLQNNTVRKLTVPSSTLRLLAAKRTEHSNKKRTRQKHGGRGSVTVSWSSRNQTEPEMAMSNLYSKIATKPVSKRIENMSVSQTNAWMNAETLTNGSLSLSPPPTSNQQAGHSHPHSMAQKDTGGLLQVMQPASNPGSPPPSPPLASPIGQGGTLDPNWQALKPTVRERNAAMFNNDLMADIRFVVGSPGSTQIIPAHKYVLATGSSVFYAMFYGGLAECKEEIEVPDVEPSAFLILLKYLYCDEIHLEADTVLATLYVAKKYIVPHLARACVNYLETSLTAKNACLLLSQSRLFEEPELMQRCWEVIDAQAEMALKSDGFVDIDMSTLESVLGRETLNCKEMNLLEAALNWAAAECSRRDMEPTPQNKRAVLGNALYLIRIPTMTLEEFANGAAQKGILTQQETIDIFFHFTANNKPNLQYPIKARAGLKSQVCHRFQSCAYRSNQWRYRGRCDSIQFSVDRRIFVVGFGLYGSSNGAADYSVKIELKRLGRVLAENNTKFFSDGSSNTFHVYFDNPIQVEPETFYTASAVLDGGELSYFGQEGMSEVTVGQVTFQFQCSSESTNGTGVQGGQIPELIFYGPAHEEH